MESLSKNTTLDEDDSEMGFTEVFAIVKGKMANKLPMTTTKEALMEELIKEWVELFGYDSL